MHQLGRLTPKWFLIEFNKIQPLEKWIKVSKISPKNEYVKKSTQIKTKTAAIQGCDAKVSTEKSLINQYAVFQQIITNQTLL